MSTINIAFRNDGEILRFRNKHCADAGENDLRHEGWPPPRMKTPKKLSQKDTFIKKSSSLETMTPQHDQLVAQNKSYLPSFIKFDGDFPTRSYGTYRKWNVEG